MVYSLWSNRQKVPIVSVGSYLLVESHVPSASAILFPTVVTFLYGMIMLYLNYKDRFDGPYPFFRIKNQSAMATVLVYQGTDLFSSAGNNHPCACAE